MRILSQFYPVVKSIACNLLRISRVGFDFADGVVAKVLDQMWD